MTRTDWRTTTIALAAALHLAACQTVPAGGPLTGTWTLVRAEDTSGGRTQPFYGENPNGRIIFDADGRYMLTVLRSDLPDYAPRDGGTPEVNRAVVVGSIANFGSYRVDGDALLLTIDGSTYRRWQIEHGSDGAKGPQRRPFKLNGDTLTYTVDPSSSGGVARFEWRREGRP